LWGFGAMGVTFGDLGLGFRDVEYLRIRWYLQFRMSLRKMRNNAFMDSFASVTLAINQTKHKAWTSAISVARRGGVCYWAT